MHTLFRYLSDTFQIPSRQYPATCLTSTKYLAPSDKNFDLAVGGWVGGWVVGWVGGNQVENRATLWSNLQVCKISSRVEIPKLDPSVAIVKSIYNNMKVYNDIQ